MPILKMTNECHPVLFENYTRSVPLILKITSEVLGISLFVNLQTPTMSFLVKHVAVVQSVMLAILAISEHFLLPLAKEWFTRFNFELAYTFELVICKLSNIGVFIDFTFNSNPIEKVIFVLPWISYFLISTLKISISVCHSVRKFTY